MKTDREIAEKAWIFVIGGQNERDRRLTEGVLLEARRLGFRRIMTMDFDGSFINMYLETNRFKDYTLAVIGHLRDVAVVRDLSRRGVPLVFFGHYEGDAMRKASGGKGVICGTDNAAIGRMAADYLLGQGRYASFAYLDYADWSRDEWWTCSRREAFVAELKAHGAEFAKAFCLREDGSDPERMISNFRDTVTSLPKPLALFACNDVAARDACMCCDILGLRIPDEIAILGVDNDVEFGETAPVGISSIAPETLRLGRNAMDLVARMLHGEKPVSLEVDCPPSHIVERHSTSTAPLEDLFVGKAVDYISAHAGTAISVSQVAKACGASRRYLERRFKALTGRTILDAIHAKRLAVVEKLLRDPSLSITEIALETGFNNVSGLCELFRRTYGVSMGEWRRRNAAVASD